MGIWGTSKRMKTRIEKSKMSAKAWKVKGRELLPPAGKKTESGR